MEPVRHDDPRLPGYPESEASAPATVSYAWAPRSKFQHRWWLHSLLFLLTIASTWLRGGTAYSITILAILGCHEFGHYFMCRYYDVDASLPYFVPFPIALTGTLGAFIRIRSPVFDRRTLFDVGVAGPLAGLLDAFPVLLLGLAKSAPSTLTAR